MRTVYRVTKQLCGKRTQNQIKPIKESKNKVLTTEREITEKWELKVLNRSEPENPSSSDPENETEDICTDQQK